MPVQYLIAIGAVVFLDLAPVDDIQGQAFHDRADHFVALGILINEFPLILRADIKTLIVTDDAFLGIIEIALTDLTDGHF